MNKSKKHILRVLVIAISLLCLLGFIQVVSLKKNKADSKKKDIPVDLVDPKATPGISLEDENVDIDKIKVIPSGEPIGVYLKTEGILVVDVGEYKIDDNTLVSPAKGKLKTGDYIVAINDEKVEGKAELIEKVKKSGDKQVKIKFIRDGQERTCLINPIKGIDQNYMLGVWVKDDISGIGTATFIYGDTFYGLGHSVSDNDTGLMLKCSGGGVYSTNIFKIDKSENFLPGQLEGSIFYKKDLIGIIEKNTKAGIVGIFNEDFIQEKYSNVDKMYLASKNQVTTGKAYIYSRITGSLKKYEIRINDIDMNSQNKNLDFTVTDKELLNLTGGIVQGMSGSPIIQEDRVIGAVTHVLVDDPTNGYGIFIETMISQ